MKTRLLLSALLFAATVHAQGDPEWHREFPAFNIAGNLYYVGTADLAVYLVHTPQGNILINSNFPEDLPSLRKSVASLGFHMEDTKILLISHAHGDHDGGIGQLQRETGARLMVMQPDVSEVESSAKGRPGAHVDRILHDADTVELGGSVWTAHLTPGHTPGCTTWTARVDSLNAVIVGSPNVNSGYFLVRNKNYPAIATDYVRTFEVLKSLPCDIFLGAHGAYFGLKAKYAKIEAGDKRAFIDPKGYKDFVAAKEGEFRAEWERQKQHPDSPKQ